MTFKYSHLSDEVRAPYVGISERTMQTSVAEHEILLSFRDDSAAELFEYWWHDTGQHLFIDHCIDQRDEDVDDD